MSTLSAFVGRSFIVASASLLVAIASCQGPDEFYRYEDGGLTGAAANPQLDASGVGGRATGTAGTSPAGTAGATGQAGTTGAAGRGGTTGAAGTGARGGTTGAAGMGGRGGTTGAAGMGGRGGATGAAGMGGRGGTTGAGGRGGTTGGAGMGGRGGTTGTAGRGGTTGAAGMGGRSGTTDAGGMIGGTGPCAGICANPGEVAPNTNSGDLGTAETCDEVIGNVRNMVCGNFVAPRTLTVNGTAEFACAGGNVTLPAARNGGYCMQASAGNYSYAYFATY